MASPGSTAASLSDASAPVVSLQAVQAHAEQLEQEVSSLAAERAARNANLTASRPGDAELGRLDASVKKNGAFIKKLRALSAESRASLLAEAARLNSSKYVSEAAVAIVEAQLRTVDIPAAVEVVAFLHARYAELAPALGPALAKAAAGSGKAAAGDDERGAARRQRSALRLLIELLAVGVLQDAQGLLLAVKGLVVGLDWQKDADASTNSATLLGTVAKAARQLLMGGSCSSTVIQQQQQQQQQQQDDQAEEGSGGGSGRAGVAVPATLLPVELVGASDAELAALPPDLSAAVRRLQAAQAALAEEQQQRFALPSEQQLLLSRMLQRGLDTCSSALVDAHTALALQERENARTLATRAQLPETTAAAYEAARRAYSSLHRATAALADALGAALPELKEDAFTRLGAAEEAGAGGGGGGGGGGAAAGGDTDSGAPEHVFEDPEERAFYESLPDVWSLVPAALLRDGVSRRPSTADGAVEGGASAGGADTAEAADGEAAEAAEQTAADGAETAAEAAAKESSKGMTAADAAPLSGVLDTGGHSDAPEQQQQQQPSALPDADVDSVLRALPRCVSADLADELAVNFLFANSSKGARKRLVRALLDLPRGGLALLPFWGRITATVSQVYPEVGAGVLAAIEAEFEALSVRKDLTRAGEEPWLRAARYLAELTKFRIAPPSVALLRLRALLDDFSGPAVDGTAALLEGTGRFLLRLPESRVRADNLLGVMTRLRNARNLDSRQSNALDSAYFACRPPAGGVRRRKSRTPVQEYVRHLLYEKLSESSISRVLKALLKLPWSQPDTEQYLLKCMLKVSRVRYDRVALLASLAGGIAAHHDSLGVGLVDLVLEDVRWGLDNPAQGNYQQRLAQVRLLGEAYNYMLLDSRCVLDVLHTIIGHGHDTPERAAALDPPDDFFRVRLVTALLATCGSFFNKGAARRRLDRFITFLQAYVAAKQPLPLDIDADLHDLLGSLRPALRWPKSYEEAVAAVDSILAQEAAAAATGLPTIDEDDDDDDGDDDKSDDNDDDEGGMSETGSDGDGKRRQRRRRGAQGDSLQEQDAASAGGGDDGSEDDDYNRGTSAFSLDEDFEREYSCLLQECQGRAPAALLRPAPVPQPHSTSSSRDGGAGGTENSSSGSTNTAAVAFKLIMRRGGKDDRTREVLLPPESSAAQRLIAQQRSEAEERSAIKALVLEASEREQNSSGAGNAGAVRGGGGATARRGSRGRGRHGDGGMHRYTTAKEQED